MIHQLKRWYPRLSFNSKVMQTLTWKTVKNVDMAALVKESGAEEILGELATTVTGRSRTLYGTLY